MDENSPTLPALGIFIEQRLREVEAEHAALTHSLEQVRAYQAPKRTCPFCGGQMLYLKPLRDEVKWLGRSYDGITIIEDGVPHFWQDWECQDCLVTRMDHNGPPGSSEGRVEERWDRATMTQQTPRTPARLFKKYPRLQTIIKHSRGYQRNWYLATDDGCWYHFLGPAHELLDWLPDVG